jgi:hypothetical protein
MEPGDRQLPGLTACSTCTGDTLTGQEPSDTQLDRLTQLERDGVTRLRLVECLDVCDRDVVVARPSRLGRASGGRPVWFTRVAGDAVTRQLRSWLEAGGPGRAPLPVGLRPLRTRRPD